MTQNQINYARIVEDRRHNLATERQSAIELAETQRHNVYSEGVSNRSLTEQGRHNLATESLSWYGAQETARHNLRSEDLNWYIAPSQVSSNYAQGDRASAAANLDRERAAIVSAQYELEAEKVRNDLYTKLQQLAQDERRVALSEKQFRVEADRIETQIADILYRQGLDFESVHSQVEQRKAQAWSSYASGVKSLTDSFLELFDWMWGLKNGLLPSK